MNIKVALHLLLVMTILTSSVTYLMQVSEPSYESDKHELDTIEPIKVTNKLQEYVIQGKLNGNYEDEESNKIKKWIFKNTGRNFWLLFWAAKICFNFESGQEYQGHLYLLKADNVLQSGALRGVPRQDYVYHRIRNEIVFKVTTRSANVNEWPDKEQLLADLETWKAKSFTSVAK